MNTSTTENTETAPPAQVTNYSPLAQYIERARAKIREAIQSLGDPDRPEEIELDVALDEQGNPCTFNSVIVHRARFVVSLQWPEEDDEPVRQGTLPAKKKGGK